MNSDNKLIFLKILQEIEFNFKNSSKNFEGLIQIIINKRIFVTGADRAGLIMKSLGIRLMQPGGESAKYKRYNIDLIIKL